MVFLFLSFLLWRRLTFGRIHSFVGEPMTADILLAVHSRTGDWL